VRVGDEDNPQQRNQRPQNAMDDELLDRRRLPRESRARHEARVKRVDGNLLVGVVLGEARVQRIRPEHVAQLAGAVALSPAPVDRGRAGGVRELLGRVVHCVRHGRLLRGVVGSGAGDDDAGCFG